MNFRNKDDALDFKELPSAAGNYGYYGTNHLKEQWHKDFAAGMEHILKEVVGFAENEVEGLFWDCGETEAKLKQEVTEDVMNELVDRLTGEIAFMIVGFGDDEHDPNEDEKGK